jgi:murein DD-endopeptidase MepM/ murein hydrolase activator NlpD
MARHRSTYLYLVLVVGVISLFATCKSTPKSEEADKEKADSDTAEIVLKELEEFTEEIPAKISLVTEEAYSFQRQVNSYSQSYFRNPFDSTIFVSGTFCELRGTHFHAGLDIRTGGHEGWEVLAVADGYVERVKVDVEGYGRVVYIRHPNGFTSVYGHLQKFTGALANYVKETQYKSRKFEVDLYPKAGEIKLTKGQNFAISGNTGGSAGPHLHFEIRDKKGKSTNPLLHGLNVADNIKPVIKRISIYERNEESLYAEGEYPYTTVSKWSEIFKRTKALNLKPGSYSFGLQTDDYFTDRNNVLGVNYCWVTANGKLLYEYQIEKFSFDQGRYIYTHTDPYLRWNEGRTYIRLFKEKYNPLPYYRQNQNGEITLKHGDSIQLKVFIQDYVGLTDSISWVVVGDTAGKKLVVEKKTTFEEVKRVSGTTSFKFYEWKINIEDKAVYHPFDFKMSIKPKKEGMLSKTFQMHYPYTPLHTYIYIDYTVPPEWLKYGNKLCAVSFDGRTHYEGGVLKGNVLSFRTRSLGDYAITYDDKPPVLRARNVGKNFKFSVSENLSKISQIICSLDGKWILAEYEPKTGAIWGEVPNWIPAGVHDFKLIVIDGRENRVEFNQKMTL